MRSYVVVAIFLAVFLAQESLGKSISQQAENELHSLQKRDGVDFMGMRVSYPQYLRLVAIQREVIRMDQTIRHMLNNYDAVELAQNPHWMELLELYDSLKKMLPPEYLARMGNSPAIPPQFLI